MYEGKLSRQVQRVQASYAFLTQSFPSFAKA
jgi:hypothetical protein